MLAGALLAVFLDIAAVQAWTLHAVTANRLVTQLKKLGYDVQIHLAAEAA